MNVAEIIIDGNDEYEYIENKLDTDNIFNVEFRHCDLTIRDLINLTNQKEYQKIVFYDCVFEDESYLKNIKSNSLSFINSKIQDYSFLCNIKKLEALTIVGSKIQVELINTQINLKYLRLSGSEIINIENITLDKLEYLFIDETNILNLDFLINLLSLKVLCISEEQEKSNLDIIYYIKNKVKIINDIIEMSGAIND